MYSKFVASILVICFCGANAVTYQEASAACKTEYKLTSDGPLDYFLANGDFQPDYKTLKCFFSCLGSKLNLIDSQGILDGEKVKTLSAQNPNEADLKAFADPDIQKACLPVQSAGQSACDNVYKYAVCAIQSTGKPKALNKTLSVAY